MSGLTLSEKACRVIEILSGDDFCEDLTCKIGLHNDCTLVPDEVKLVERKLSMIWRFTHVANNPSCIKSHDNWVAELNKVYDEFTVKGYFKHLEKDGQDEQRSKG